MLKELSVLFIGDVVGEPGIKAIDKYLPSLIEKYDAKLVVVNGENADKGKGISEIELNKLLDNKVDVITTGNHIWDNWKSKPLLANHPYLIRPYNYPPGNPGRGFVFKDIEGVGTIAVLQLQGRLYVHNIDCPFRIADNALKYISEKTKIIIVDFHADATAEKASLAWYLDGRISALFGTHTHIQTADACIMPKGMAFITDVGMTGPYNSVVGMKKEVALNRFILQTAHKYELAKDDVRICGVSVLIDIATGKTKKIQSFMIPEPIKEIIEE